MAFGHQQEKRFTAPGVGRRFGAGVIGGSSGDGPKNKSGLTLVAGIENAPELVVASQEGIDFIDEQRGRKIFDHAKKSRRADIGGGDDAVSEFMEERQESGFAATFLGRFDTEISGDVAQLKGVRVQDPEGDSLRGPFGQNHTAVENADELVKQCASVNRVGPGFDFRHLEDGAVG